MQAQKVFVDDVSTLVNESIDGLLLSSGGSLKRLDGFDNSIRVVVRADYAALKGREVALVSGGGAGHEPLHAGFVGDGMLTAAVCGDIFASPSTDAVLAAIRTVAGEKGCLLIIKNYTGDRLNFGIAAEQARARYGVEVRTLFVRDDAALPGAPQPRGVAGTVLLGAALSEAALSLVPARDATGQVAVQEVEKFAGHLARAGRPLAEVAERSAAFLAGVATVGASLTTCTIPGAPRDPRLDGPWAELGLGIHGEPGAARVALPPPPPGAAAGADAGGSEEEEEGWVGGGQAGGAGGGSCTALVRRAVEALKACPAVAGAPAGAPFLLLVNNLAGATPLELALLARKALQLLAAAGVNATHVSVGTLVTALDMKGFSLTLARLDGGGGGGGGGDAPLEALLSPAGPAAWAAAAPRPVVAQETLIIPCPSQEEEEKEDGFVPLRDEFKQVVTDVLNKIIEMEGQLTEWDQKVGDGDCGTTLKKGAETVLADLDSYPDQPDRLCRALARSIARSMGGTSGVILRLFFLAAASPALGGFGAALTAGTKSVMDYGGAKVGSRTMVDALAPAMEAAEAGKSVAEMATAARAGADLTAEMATAHDGRSSYLTTDLCGIPDPGAVAVAAALEAVAHALANLPPPGPQGLDGGSPRYVRPKSALPGGGAPLGGLDGNYSAGRPSTRVRAPPGGHSSITFG